ncbi:rifin PIR protein, putative [Plasmodium reichenowi]|uniref:Rifin PIR protein, putative n=1 Tax=Plasmodium reichenowi TaxID=5854 RepID=A0A2P9DKU7_PLARE|nr:rifin PIR protein, putative [Plasmodium reichenowi]
MKVHYINILLFVLPLNIFAHNNNNKSSIAPRHTPKIPTTRLLCKCELYAPANYDSDLEMKRVMENFNKQTQQRFHEYDERMKTTRQKCKDRCDKEIQKIILKDKLEKELMDKFATLQTDIKNDAIPTCICEKSLADKVEKNCLKCGSILGSVMPELGLIGGTALYTLNQWSITATAAAMESAKKAGMAAATKAAMKEVILQLQQFVSGFSKDAVSLTPIVNNSSYNSATALFQNAKDLLGETCIFEARKTTSEFCNTVIHYGGESTFKSYAQTGSEVYKTTLPYKTAAFEKTKVSAVDATYASCQTAIIAPVVAIVVIVLVMVIIYLILRYRRKKKMKKKLQYIKLLEE